MSDTLEDTPASGKAGGRTTAPCLCAGRGYVRALEEDDFGFPDKVVTLAEVPDALLGRCQHCGAWWERLPHYVYGYAWYRTEQSSWHASNEALAVRAWEIRRREPDR